MADTREDNQKYFMEQHMRALEADTDDVAADIATLEKWASIRDIYDGAWSGDDGRLQQKLDSINQGIENLKSTVQALREREWKVR
tara:strand:+ start:294 stop:548 length:255 start_codon:yes stop_codon:yes gene_type:complete